MLLHRIVTEVDGGMGEMVSIKKIVEIRKSSSLCHIFFAVFHASILALRLFCS